MYIRPLSEESSVRGIPTKRPLAGASALAGGLFWLVRCPVNSNRYSVTAENPSYLDG